MRTAGTRKYPAYRELDDRPECLVLQSYEIHLRYADHLKHQIPLKGRCLRFPVEWSFSGGSHHSFLSSLPECCQLKKYRFCSAILYWSLQLIFESWRLHWSLIKSLSSLALGPKVFLSSGFISLSDLSISETTPVFPTNSDFKFKILLFLWASFGKKVLFRFF